jgi:hypothetical protein
MYSRSFQAAYSAITLLWLSWMCSQISRAIWWRSMSLSRLRL